MEKPSIDFNYSKNNKIKQQKIECQGTMDQINPSSKSTESNCVIPKSVDLYRAGIWTLIFSPPMPEREENRETF